MVTEPHAWRDDLGAFVLGHLDTERDLAIRSHLTGCPACSAEVAELRPVAAVLSAANPDRLSVPAGPPPELLDRILDHVDTPALRRARHRWSWPSALAGAAAAAAVAAVLAVVTPLGSTAPPGRGPSPAPREAVSFAVVPAGAQVDANLVAHTWGTEIELVARGLAPGRTYTVTFIRSDGSRVPAGTFLGVADRPVRCDLNAALLRKDATSVVVTSGSAVVLRADL